MSNYFVNSLLVLRLVLEHIVCSVSTRLCTVDDIRQVSRLCHWNEISGISEGSVSSRCSCDLRRVMTFPKLMPSELCCAKMKRRELREPSVHSSWCLLWRVVYSSSLARRVQSCAHRGIGVQQLCRGLDIEWARPNGHPFERIAQWSCPYLSFQIVATESIP